jgi:hypothetical protein
MLLKRLLLAALLLQPLFAQQGIIGQPFGIEEGNRIEAEALFSRASRGGFLPVRVTISNKSKIGGKVRLHCVSSNKSADESQVVSDFNLNADAEKTTIQDLLIPLFNPGTGGRGSETSSVDIEMTGTLGTGSGSVSALDATSDPLVLLSEPLYTKNASTLDGEVTKRSGGGGRSSFGADAFAGKFDSKMLPDDWRAYSGYDAIGMTDSDWTGMSPGARNALLQWNRLGGRLVIYSQTNADLKSLGIKTDDANGTKSARSLGSVQILPLPADLHLDEKETVNLFYGDPAAATALATTSSASVPKGFHQRVNEDYESAWALQKEFGDKSFQYAIFILVLIAFAILVGPVNLFVFAKSGRRHRLFITTPLIAVGASAVLIVMIFLQDGIGGRGMRLALMEVRSDNSENAAYVHQEQISRTGVLLGSDFTLEGQAMITPVRLGASKWARFTNGAERSWRFEEQAEEGNLKVSGDWFQSRSEQAQVLEAVIPTRGRIEARNEAGAPVFLSTFDFPIKTLWYTDDSGTVWQAGDITPGKAFTCVNGSAVPMKAEADRFSVSLRKNAETLFARKGHFVAITDAAPGLDTFKNISWKQTHTVITGPIAKP